MKHWWQNVAKNYLTFTKKERTGILLFFVLMVAVFLVSRYYPVATPPINKDAFQQELADLKISVDSSRKDSRFVNEDYPSDYSRPKYDESGNVFRGELFAFDPNTLDANGWKRLGVREKTITIIHNFLAKGYQFRQPADLAKIYGLKKEEAERLIPYVRIPGKENATNRPFVASDNTPMARDEPRKPASAKVIEINSGDTAAFISLPGIGSKLAARIVSFREKLGGFSSVNQLAETYGIADSTFQLIKPLLQCNAAVVKRFNINTAEASELRIHPYLKWNIANAIVNYRKQHGNYKSVEDLKQIDIITPDIFARIAPYLTL